MNQSEMHLVERVHDLTKLPGKMLVLEPGEVIIERTRDTVWTFQAVGRVDRLSVANRFEPKARPWLRANGYHLLYEEAWMDQAIHGRGWHWPLWWGRERVRRRCFDVLGWAWRHRLLSTKASESEVMGVRGLRPAVFGWRHLRMHRRAAGGQG